MTDLLQQLAQKIGHEALSFHASHVWLYRGDNKAIIIKIEQISPAGKVFVNASFARDGSGPLLASFMSLLLIDECHATQSDSIGICSGHVSVTLYHMLDLASFDLAHFCRFLENFEALASCIFDQARGKITQSNLAPMPKMASGAS